MPKYSVELSRQVVFRKTIEVEADDADAAEDLAREQVAGDDTNDTITDWEANAWASYGAPEVEELA